MYKNSGGSVLFLVRKRSDYNCLISRKRWSALNRGDVSQLAKNWIKNIDFPLNFKFKVMIEGGHFIIGPEHKKKQSIKCDSCKKQILSGGD